MVSTDCAPGIIDQADCRGRWSMKTGESVKGKDLVLSERDLLVMEGTASVVHIVCDGRICRPDSSEGSPDRGDAYWTKVGSSSRYEDYATDAAGLNVKICSKCVKALKRNGIVLKTIR
jgi:hypothetical protein